MADPITAHGWTHNPAPGFVDLTYAGESVVIFTDAHIVDDAVDDLIHCIEDAATLAKVRDVLARWDADVDANDTATLDHLLALLSEDGTP